MFLSGVDFVEQNGECSLNWSDGFIHCKGESAASQQVFEAKRSAIIVAQRNLLEVVKGVRIDSETIINNGMLTSDTIKSKVEGMVRGVEVVSNIYTKDVGIATATVKMHLGKDLVKALLDDNESNTAWNHKIKKLFEILSPTKLYAGEVYDDDEIKTLKKLMKDFKASNDLKSVNAIQSIIDGMPNSSKATGILIDARTVRDFKNAIEVKLVDINGKEIYPSAFVTKKAFVGKNGSSVGYDLSIEDARKNKRVFDKPLSIKAVSTYKNRKSDLVLTDSDIQKMVSNGSASMKEAKIIIVLSE